MDGPAQPESTIELDPRHAVDLIIDTVMAHEPGTVTLVPTGGLTNIAMAARKEPRIVERVKEVVLMGGGYHVGNWSAVAEFNIIIDPEAAHIVFNEPWPVVMVGLDLTHQALATPDVVEQIAAIGTKPARFVLELMEFFTQTYKDAQGFDYPPVHDPCAVAYVIDPTRDDHPQGPGEHRAAGQADARHDRRRFPRPGTGGLPHLCCCGPGPRKFWNLVTDALVRIGERGPGTRTVTHRALRSAEPTR